MASLSIILSFFTLPSLALFLAIFTPSVQFISLNQKFYSSKQIQISLTLAFVTGLLFSLLFYLLFDFIESLTFNEVLMSYGIKLTNIFASLCALLAFFMLAERFFAEIFANKARETKVKSFLLLFFLVISNFYSCAPLNIVFLVLLVTSFLDARKKSSETKEILFDDRVQQLYSSEYSKRGLKLTHKPNIYLLLLESYHSAQALQELYGIDDSQTDAFLQEQGFTDYEDVFSNSHITFPSIANLLHAKLHQDTRRGSAFALDVLRENGYNCEFFDSQFYVFGEYMQEKDFASFAISARDRKLYLYFGPLLGQSKYLRAFVKDVDPFKTEISFEELYKTFKERLLLKQKKPTFYALRFGADHVNVQASWNTNSEHFSKTLYPIFVQRAQKQIKEVVNSITLQDPSALILAIGDHGGLQHINIAPKRKNLQAVLKSNNVTNKEFALDMFSVRCAIKWPYAHKTKNKVLSHVNIFRYIFEALGAGEKALEDLLPNLSIYNKTNDIAVKEGKVLQEVEAYFTPELFAELKKLFDQAKASEDECLLLARHSDRRQKIEILEWAVKSYPQSEEIALDYANALYNRGEIKKSIDVAQKNLKTFKSNTFAKDYYKILSELQSREFIDLVDSQKIKKGTLDAYTKETFLINAYVHLGEKQKALLKLDELMATFPNNQNATAFMAKTCISLKEPRKALSLLLSIEHPGKYYEFWKYTTLVCLCSKELETSGEAARILVQMHPTETWSWLIYGFVLQKQGKVHEAIAQLIEAQRKAAYPAPLREFLGHIVIKYAIQDSKFQLYKSFAEKQMQKKLEFFIAHKAIDKEFYLQQKPLLKSAAMAHIDYMSEGVYEGINPNTWFDGFYYLLSSPGVWLKGLNPYIHFYEEGMMQLRNPCMKYNIREVLAENKELVDNKEVLFEKLRNKWSAK